MRKALRFFFWNDLQKILKCFYCYGFPRVIFRFTFKILTMGVNS